MDIQQIKKWLEEELSLGRSTYKEVLNFCMRLYRSSHKSDIKRYNKRYYNKINLNKDLNNTKNIKINLNKNDKPLNNKSSLNKRGNNDLNNKINLNNGVNIFN